MTWIPGPVMMLGLLGLACTSCNLLSSNTDSSGLETGLEGRVLRGPMCPVVRVDQPCPDQPFTAAFDVYDAQGEFVTRFESDAEGYFEVTLRPGTYTIIPDEAAPVIRPRKQAQEVVVQPGQVTAVTLTFDTGMR